MILTGKRRIFVLLVVIIVAVTAGVLYWENKREEEQLDHLLLRGNVDIREVSLAFNAAERINAMSAQEGDYVHAGQVLAELDASRLSQAVDRAAGQVEAQRQVVLRLERGSRPEEIRKARAEVAAAEVTARNAKRTWERQKALNEKDLTPDDTVDNTRAALEEAEAHLDAVKEALNLALAGPREEDIASAHATLSALEAGLALAKRNLEEAQLKAPANGVIRNRLSEPGDMASPQTPVYTLALTDPLWVRTYVSEPDLGRIWPGMQAEVHTDSYPDQGYAGWVGFISPTAEFTPKTVETERVRTDLVYQVRVYVCDPMGELRLGMPARVSLDLHQPREARNSDTNATCRNTP
jgi:HlyD family secretion protein